MFFDKHDRTFPQLESLENYLRNAYLLVSAYLYDWMVLNSASKSVFVCSFSSTSILRPASCTYCTYGANSPTVSTSTYTLTCNAILTLHPVIHSEAEWVDVW